MKQYHERLPKQRVPKNIMPPVKKPVPPAPWKDRGVSFGAGLVVAEVVRVIAQTFF